MRSCAIAVVPRNAHALVLLLDPTLEDAANAIGEAKDDGLETLGDRYARLSRLRAAQERAPQGARVSKIAPPAQTGSLPRAKRTELIPTAKLAPGNNRPKFQVTWRSGKVPGSQSSDQAFARSGRVKWEYQILPGEYLILLHW